MILKQKDDAEDDSISKTNKVFFIQQGRQIDFYVPTYVRLNSKKIYQVQVTEATASMIAALSISINCNGLPQQLIDQLRQYIQLSINNQRHIRLSKDQVNTDIHYDKNDMIMTYVYRDTFQMRMSGNVFMTPFDVQKVGLLITLRTIQKEYDNNVKVNIKFNCMDIYKEDIKLTFSDNTDSGEFGISETAVRVTYTNDDKHFLKDPQQMQEKTDGIQRKDSLQSNNKINENQKNNQIKKQQKPDKQQVQKILDKPKKEGENKEKPKQKEKKVKHYQHTIFQLALYRIPTTTILTIFIPVWLLGVINLAIYFQKAEFGNRIANLTLVMVAFLAFFPTIREKIPPTPKFTMIDILLYALLITSLLLLIQSGFKDGIDVAKWDWKSSPIFIISSLVVVLSLVIVLFLLLIYLLFWNPSYNDDNIRHTDGSQPIIYKEWKHEQCDKYFSQLNIPFRFGKEFKKVLRKKQ